MGNIQQVNYIYFDEIDSTNSWAKTHIDQLRPDHLTCVVARQQTAGRGQHHRIWVSPPDNLYVSLCLDIPSPCPYIGNFGQLLSYCAAAVLREKQIPVQIKWPNDLLLEGKKLGGILAEVVTHQGRQMAILGIGINLWMPTELLKAIDQPVTSLSDFDKTNWTVQSILQPLVSRFLKELERLQKQGFSCLQVQFNEWLAFRGHSVGPDGRLIVILPSGATVYLH